MMNSGCFRLSKKRSSTIHFIHPEATNEEMTYPAIFRLNKCEFCLTKTLRFGSCRPVRALALFTHCWGCSRIRGSTWEVVAARMGPDGCTWEETEVKDLEDLRGVAASLSCHRGWCKSMELWDLWPHSVFQFHWQVATPGSASVHTEAAGREMLPVVCTSLCSGACDYLQRTKAILNGGTIWMKRGGNIDEPFVKLADILLPVYPG